MKDIVTFNKNNLPKDFIFRNKKGEILGGETFIFPICIWDREKDVYYFLATGFLISRDGLIVTAKHVFEESKIQNINDYDILPEEHDLFAFAVMSKQQYYKIPIKPHRILSDESDIGFGQLYPLKHKELGNHFLFDNVLRLSSQIPRSNEHIYTYSYPGSGFFRSPLDNGNHYTFTPTVINGTALDFHQKGINSTPPLGPCVSTNMKVEQGISGGPVFIDNGQVIGVNSAMQRNKRISYFSPIKYIVEIPFECNGEETSLLKLYNEKHWIELDV